MKIAMIGHKRIPSREGGVEVVVEELSTRLVKDGYIVDAYNRGKNNNLNEYKGINIINVSTTKKKGIEAFIYSFKATVKALFRHYDIIHYHAEGPSAMVWLPHLFRIRTVVTIHGLDWQRAKWGNFASKYIKFGEKIAAKYADKIIVLSKDIQKYFMDTYNRKTEFIPNGVNKPVIREPNIIKKIYNLDKDSYILFLARIVPEKGLHYLIKAFKQINTDKKLVIVGGANKNDEYYQNIVKMAKEDNRIIMTGHVTEKKELDELFSNCCIYCLPSDIEGMPMSLLEAMSYGCNCLVSNIEENTQVISNYGTTFIKGNIKSLKNNLEKIIKEKDNRNKEEKIDYILKKYNWDNIVKQIEKIYKG